jgi:hypothetical protein
LKIFLPDLLTRSKYTVPGTLTGWVEKPNVRKCTLFLGGGGGFVILIKIIVLAK